MADKKKSGLGRGLNSIFGSDVEQFLEDIQNNGGDAPGRKEVEIPVSEIRPNPYQPRKEFEEKSLNELADSIRLHGIFTPLLVRPSVQGYELIAGERRLRAAKIAGLATVPAISVDFTDEEMMEISLLENVQRENLNPIEEAAAYESLIKRLGYTQEQLAERVGKSREYCANMLRLLMYAAGMKQGNIVIYEKKTSILQRTAEKYNATYVSEDSELYSYVSESLIPEFVRRNGIKKKCIADGLTDEEVYDVMSKEKPVFIFIDDLKDFFESAQKPSGGIGDMSGALGNLISKGKLHNIYFFGCMNVEDYGLISALKLYQPFVSVKKGMLMGASVNSQRLFAFRNIPFSETAKPLKKGNVLVVSDEDETLALKAVLPLVRRDEL